MRILAITNYFPPRYMGGAEISAYNTCLGLLDRGSELSVLMVHARSTERRDRHYSIQRIPVHQVTFSRPLFDHPFLQAFDPRVYRTVAAEIERVQPDLVHVHNVSGATTAPLVACHRLGTPAVLSLHDHWLLCPNNGLYKGDGLSCDPSKEPARCGECFRRYDFWGNIPGRRRVFARLVQGVRTFVSPSQGLVERHVAAGYDRARFQVVPYGIHPAAFQASSDPLIGEYARESRYSRTLLFAGALVETKGIGTLIEALPLLSRYVDRFCCLFAGWGDERFVSALRRFNPTTVKLLGRVPFQEMRTLYASADLTIVPSICYDNSPLVIYESYLVGTPVLGSNIGGIPELVREAETGYLFPPGDAVALTERVIQHFARSAPERRTMRRRCIDYARTHTSIDRHINRLLETYDQALRSETPRVNKIGLVARQKTIDGA